ncbi:GAF domain-containing protein [Microbacterium sp. NPDC077644]|uniref:helix-turn-helix domain-containing protein n=1 Tax=Microbacterium sp. NPDC077644 TaxID=3155055 RepID=UPI00344F29EA
MPVHDAARRMFAFIQDEGTEDAPLRLMENLAADPDLSDLVQIARRIRETLNRGAARESLLRVLFDTATDLAAITDYEKVLRTIVRRTRVLLGTDMAYISLNDYESGETYMRTTDGVITDAYRGIRMPLGTGVLGRVAAGNASAQTADYLTDPAIVRHHGIDDIVDQEGVKSLLGAPLRSGGNLMGALLVGNRYRHRFSAEEVSTVESIASLASVALNNARHLQEMHNLLSQHDATRQMLDDQVQQLEHISTHERLLTECVVAPNPLDELVSVLQTELGLAIAVLDASETKIAGDLIPSTPPVPHTEAFVATVANRSLGRIVTAGQLSEAQRRLVSRSALVLSVILLMEESRFHADQRQQSELLELLVSPTRSDSAGALRRSAKFGIRAGSQAHVSVLEVGDAELDQVLPLVRHLLGESSGIASLKDQLVVVVSGAFDGSQIHKALHQRGVRATVGFASRALDEELLASAYDAARATLDVLLALDLTNSAVHHDQLGIAGMLFRYSPAGFGSELVDAILGPLRQYDATRGTSLTETAWRYLSNDRHHDATAQDLHIHPSTVRQRVSRISQLLGSGWDAGYRKLDIQIALQMWKLRQHIQRNP